MDAGNMLKPALARGELRCVGATTLDEYRQYIEKDDFSLSPRKIAIVSSTLGSSTSTFWKRRSKAASFSSYIHS
jgi:hypothetical protein